MTTITSLSQYLNNQTSQSGSGSNTNSVLIGNALKNTANLTPSSATKTSDGDTITLSAKAQEILDKANATKKNYGFTLTTKQQEQLQKILEDYKDKPITQANFDALQKDLKKYRLDTVNMGAKEAATSFNIKSVLLSILNGKDVTNGTTERAQALATKKNAYAEQIVADWTAIKKTSTSTSTTETSS
ncbi:MAG TPA: hypothetical protein DCM27_06955 [Rhodospirillaceae bacterium]|nr:hypothetical protein [Rhodospirillaceae bacterium]